MKIKLRESGFLNKREERLKVDEKATEEDKFCITVLTKAKEIFGEDATKIDADKMVKLCCFVADDLKYHLTRGWYK